MFENEVSYIMKIPRGVLLAVGVILSLFIAYIDYLSGWEMSYAVVYLLPIYLISWGIGKTAGISIAVLCALLRFGVSVLENAPHGSFTVIIANVSMRLIFFILTAYLFSSLKQSLVLADTRSKIDALTLIPNRRYFNDFCEREIARMQRYQQPFTVGYMDIDNFKNVNDIHGHTVGNALLKAVSAILQKQIRTTDVVSRLGGDEFAIILSETGEDGAALFFQRLKTALDDEMGAHHWLVTFSIGVMTFSLPPSGVDEVLQLSDALMYESKKGGKNRITCSTYRPSLPVI